MPKSASRPKRAPQGQTRDRGQTPPPAPLSPVSKPFSGRLARRGRRAQPSEKRFRPGIPTRRRLPERDSWRPPSRRCHPSPQPAPARRAPLGPPRGPPAPSVPAEAPPQLESPTCGASSWSWASWGTPPPRPWSSARAGARSARRSWWASQAPWCRDCRWGSGPSGALRAT